MAGSRRNVTLLGSASLIAAGSVSLITPQSVSLITPASVRPVDRDAATLALVTACFAPGENAR